ncbi:hypothetical protein ACFP1Z_27820 [Streptomyces gamaensis]|uniref:Asparagine synthase n=1 Tax=Streptomyces gamaensis TaxID=1763542 RepID=A0ABW0Z599_9ACTN
MAGTCAHEGRAVGFVGLFRTGGVSVTQLRACGCRIPAVGKVEWSAFDDLPEPTRTWCNPATRAVGREALAQLPVFYTETGDGVRFATDPRTAAGPGARPYGPAVAALLTGAAVPPPLTPWQGVYRLPPGSELSWSDGRLRIRLHDIDLRELPATGIRQALVHALAMLPAGQLAVSGGSGSMALARLAADEGLPLTAAHARVDVPVLDLRHPRITGVLPACEVTDASAAWQARRDRNAVLLPADCDPWAEVLTARGGGLLPVAGTGVHVLLSPSVVRRPWWRRGWQRLVADQPAQALNGQPPQRAWSQLPALPPQPDAGDGLLGAGALRAAAEARAAWTAGHLVPRDARPPVRARIATIAALLDACPGPSRALLPVLHPAVVGTVLTQARERPQRSLLHQLLPADIRPADPPGPARERLLAAAWATARLADHDRRAALLHRLSGSGWVRHDALARALASDSGRLRHSLELHRICATSAAWPQAFHEHTSPAARPVPEPPTEHERVPEPAPPADVAGRLRLGDGLSVHPLPFGGAMVVDRRNLTALEIDPSTADVLTGTAPIRTFDLPGPVRDRLAGGVGEGWLRPVGLRGGDR